MGRYLKIAFSIRNAIVRDNIAQGVMRETLEAWEECNSFNTYSNGASEDFITIYSKD